MILILSEDFDKPTERVISKLKEKKANYFVIYGSDFINKKISINITDKIIKYEDKILKDIEITWFRRWINRKYEFSDNVNENNYLKEEFHEYSANFMNYLPTKKWLNTPPYIKTYPTKSLQLKTARDCGLYIPNTLVTNNKDSLKTFFKEKSGNIITKNLSNPFTFVKEGINYASYTTIVDKKDIDSQSLIFFPSIFQENIQKEIELRVFYFHRRFYTYAIFSSKNKQTSIDFRVYDHDKPNKIMKYELPTEIKDRLTNFMEKLDLHTGSIDLIKSGSKYIFLEVNCQGMFGGMENYGLNIEEDIANYLIEKDEVQ